MLVSRIYNPHIILCVFALSIQQPHTKRFVVIVDNETIDTYSRLSCNFVAAATAKLFQIFATNVNDLHSEVINFSLGATSNLIQSFRRGRVGVFERGIRCVC